MRIVSLPSSPSLVLVLALVLLTFALGGCGESTPPSTERPIVFIGVDSADWTWIDPLMEEGRMPHLASLVERGARGPLTSLVPLQKSPTIWTTIATGKRPVKHGIADFITREERVQTSELRQAATYWEILGQLGRRQAVLGWWITYPATPVEGILVSDFLPYIDDDERMGRAAVHPPELWDEVADLVVRPEDVDDALLARFVDLDLVREHGEIGEEMLVDLRTFLAGDLTYMALTRRYLEPGAFDVFTVYFRGLDMASHSYWRWFEPRYSSIPEDDWRVRAFGNVIPAYHEFVDELIGEVVALADPQSRFVVVSDHGFVGHRRRGGQLTVGVKMHREDGILVLAGPGVREGATIEGAQVKDVMPTLLAMCGVPLARDLDGHLLGNAFAPSVQDWYDTLLTHSVESYEGLVPARGARGGVDDEVNEAVLEQLRSLGYIE